MKIDDREDGPPMGHLRAFRRVVIAELWPNNDWPDPFGIGIDDVVKRIRELRGQTEAIRATMPTLSEADERAALLDRNRALEDEVARLRAGQ